MPITPLPTPPSRQRPDDFSDEADAFLGALPTFGSEANTLETNVNAKEVTASAAAVTCSAAEAVALAASNFKGEWDDLTGAAAIPYSVFHSNKYWMLITGLADITAKEPGVDVEWEEISTVTFATAAEIIAGTETDKSIAPDQLKLAGIVPAVLPTGWITGLGMSNAADTDHDITVAAGKARDATDAADLVLASAITKRFDADWSVGSTNGGFATGESLPASGTIHVWLIKRSDTGVVDVLANNHATTGLTPTLPAGYDYKRLIGSYRTNASNNIINGDWRGTGVLRTFLYDTPILDVSYTTPGTSAITSALSTPGGIATFAIMNFVVGSGGSVYVSSLDNADMAGSHTAAPGWTVISPGYTVSCQGRVKTNTSSQIRHRGADAPIYLSTLGYEMSL
jgi:hypothetical protein